MTRRRPKGRSAAPWKGKIGNFLKTALKDYGRVGSILPSSRWTVRAIGRQLPRPLRCLIEYGPGDGAVTRGLLQGLSQDTQVVAFELNPEFLRIVRKISDPRFSVVEGNVLEWSGRLREWQANGVDAVVSGIPFSFLTPEERDLVVRNTYEGLRVGGRLIVYQNSLLMKPCLMRYFSEVKSFLEPRNIFPYFIMVATRGE